MAEESPYEKDLRSIHHLMERSARVVSLSGFSGILAGCYALAGAWLAQEEFSLISVASSADIPRNASVRLVAAGIGVLAAALITLFLMSSRRARKLNVSLWGEPTRVLLGRLAVPLATGGAFVLVLIAGGHWWLAVPAMLMFYGIAVVSVSSSTFDEVRYLGLAEIILGLAAAAWPAYGLYAWAAGFGVLHILYGAILYKKYER